MSLSSRSSFMIAVVVLTLCAVGLEGATRFMKLHFRKEAVPLAQPLEAFPSTLGKWVQVTPDSVLKSDEEHILGTKDYVMRAYVDTSIVSPSLVDGLRLKDEDTRKAVLAQIAEKAPEAIVSLMVTYYTGMADTVAHVPDRCYIADGYDVASADVLNWPKSGRTVRYLTFEDATTSMSRVRKNVAYCFSVNGQWAADPIEVRRIMGNLFAKHGYYAKIELMTQQIDRDKAAAVMDAFLSDALPAVQKALPDWDQYKGK
jgi:hypothetical protein